MSKEQIKKEEGGIGETIKVVLQALLLALVLRSFIVQPFSIPSGSMMGTLLIGDYLFVSKYSYGYSRFSFPFGIIPFEGRILAGAPERGDIAVFRLPTNTSTDYIKRVIGLPGDTIQMIDGVLHINGTEVKREKVDDFQDNDRGGSERRVARYRETLPDGKSYLTLDLVSNSRADNTDVYTVPAGHYFMMGDNRDNSQDSRFSEVGYVPVENFIGRAEFLFFSLKAGTSAWQIWKWPTDIRFGRLFNGLRANR
ncbi:MAG: signal peptidase I [Rhizobiales bacterium]|nr:signal peptidase I [Hyphomicrobiales bacterium]